jgi:hypothetical protein
VEAGHRAIKFHRIGGLGNDVYKEGLHFRIPWFEYPIICSLPIFITIKKLQFLAEIQMTSVHGRIKFVLQLAAKIYRWLILDCVFYHAQIRINCQKSIEHLE